MARLGLRARAGARRRTPPKLGGMAAGPRKVPPSEGAIDWEKYRSWDDYRGYVNLPVLGKAIGRFAGTMSFDQVLYALDAVFKFAYNAPINWGQEDKVDAAAEIAIETARHLYEQDMIDRALSRLMPRWYAWVGRR